MGVGSKDTSGRRITSNSMSMVLRVSVSGKPIAILPGDLDVIGLDDLLDNVDETELLASVFVYPHHGGRPGAEENELFAERILNKVTPSIVVFSIGRGSYQTPNPNVIGKLRSLFPDARIVCTQLSEHCSISNPNGTYDHLSNVFSQGRVNQTCCGGTIVVPLDDLREIEPSYVNHVRFIQSYVETPLCCNLR